MPIPDTLSGSSVQLVLQEGTWEFHPGEVVDTYGYNGSLLGPTIILYKGQQVTLNVTNALPDLTTTHWHGMHVSPENDGGPHSLIYPNTTWSPSFTVLDRASTFWYHPHGHGLTDYQVTKGAAGMIIVRDSAEATLVLPRTYGVDDLPLIIQAKAVVGGQVSVHTGLDSIIVVNGARQPLAQVPAQVVRLRCLNGASERTFMLGFTNDMPFHVIGTDGGLLTAPVQRTRLQLMPGERAELLVDLTGMTGSAFEMLAYNSELPTGIIGSPQVGNGMATLDGYEDNALNGADHPIMSFAVGPQTAGAVTTVIPYLVNGDYLDPADATVTRTFIMEPESMGPMEMIEGPFEINGALMDMDVINEVVMLGATEIWELTNNTQLGHPVHIHDIQFNILDRNGLPPEQWELGWKDVVYVPPMGSARVLMRFDDFADPEMPYMYHCHLLMHEDEGMMGQFLVIDPNGIDETPGAPVLTAWPVPADEALALSWGTRSGPVLTEWFDATGRCLKEQRTVLVAGTARLDLSGMPNGMHTVRMTDEMGRQATARAIIQH